MYLHVCMHIFFLCFTYITNTINTHCFLTFLNFLTGSTLFVDTTVEVNVRDNNEQPAMVAQSMTKTEDDTRFAFRFDLNAGNVDILFFGQRLFCF